MRAQLKLNKASASDHGQVLALFRFDFRFDVGSLFGLGSQRFAQRSQPKP